MGEIAGLTTWSMLSFRICADFLSGEASCAPGAGWQLLWGNWPAKKRQAAIWSASQSGCCLGEGRGGQGVASVSHSRGHHFASHPHIEAGWRFDQGQLTQATASPAQWAQPETAALTSCRQLLLVQHSPLSDEPEAAALLQVVDVVDNDDAKKVWLMSRLQALIDQGDVLIFASQKARVDQLCDQLKAAGIR